MNDSLDTLYADIILEYASNPILDDELSDQNRTVVFNPSCGDKVELVWQNSTVKCHVDGCAICRASAGIMLDLVGVTNASHMPNLISDIEHIVSKGTVPKTLQNADIAALSGVAQFPNRVRCALLPWEALSKSLNPKIQDGRYT